MLDFSRIAAMVVAVGAFLLVFGGPAVGQVRYGGEVGDSHAYLRIQQDRVRQTVGGREQALDIESRWRLSARLVEVRTDSLTIEIVHDSIAMTGLPPEDTPDFSAVYGLPVVVVLGPSGAVGSVTLPDPLPAAARRLDLETTYRTFFPELPDGGLGPASTWVDTLEVESVQNGVELTVHRIDTYRAAGPSERGGLEAVRVDYATALEVEGEGRQEGSQVSLSGSGEGRGAFFFAPDPGLYLGGTEETELRMNAFVTAGGQNLLIPIVTRRTESVELVE